MSVAESLASTYTAQIGGTSSTFQPFTQSDKGLMEQWARHRTYRAVADLRGVASPEDYADLLAGYRADCAAGRHAINGDLFVAALGSLEGHIETVRLMLLRHHPKITSSAVLALVESHNEEVLEAMAAVDPKMAVAIARAREEAEKG